MIRPFRFAVIALALATSLASPVYADDATPVGIWQTSTGESHYLVSFCGGEKLCAKLTWLRSDARTPENLAYLNRYIVRGAVATSSNKWKGIISYDGQEIPGRMTLVNNDKMVLSGCQAIFCQTVEFERI